MFIQDSCICLNLREVWVFLIKLIVSIDGGTVMHFEGSDAFPQATRGQVSTANIRKTVKFGFGGFFCSLHVLCSNKVPLQCSYLC